MVLYICAFAALAWLLFLIWPQRDGGGVPYVASAVLPAIVQVMPLAVLGLLAWWLA